MFSVITGRSGALDGGTLYVTITALICACFGLGVSGTWRWFLLTITGFILLVALAGNTPFGWLAYGLPLLKMVREPVRILYLYQFCFAALAASGLQMALNGIPRRGGRFTIFVIVMSIFACEARQQGFPSASTNSPLTADQAYRKTLLITFLEERNRADPGMYRVLARPKDLIPPNDGDIFRLSTVLGYRSSMLISYFDLLNKDWSVSSSGLDRIGARYFLTDAPVAGFPVLATEGNKTLYERTSAQPILRLEPNSGAVSEEGISQVAWKRNGVSLRVQAKERARLVFAESAFPGWFVRVNGARAVLKQNGPFMSVWLNAGSSEVDWIYRPWWFVPGMLGWLIGALFLLSAALPDRWRHLLTWKLRSQLGSFHNLVARHARLFGAGGPNTVIEVNSPRRCTKNNLTAE